MALGRSVPYPPLVLRVLRSTRLPALLAVLSLALGVAAPAVACVAMGMPTGSADRGAMEAPCSMPDHDPAPPEPTAPADDCCVVTSPAVPVAAASVPVPPAPVVVLALSVIPRVPAPAAAVTAEAAGPPPRPPGPLHLLHGCFLT